MADAINADGMVYVQQHGRYVAAGEFMHYYDDDDDDGGADARSHVGCRQQSQYRKQQDLLNIGEPT